MNETWSSLSVAETEEKLKTSAASGLSPKAARSRAGGEGQGVYRIKRVTYSTVLGEIFADAPLLLLLATGFLALIFREVSLGLTVVLFCAVYLLLLFGVRLLCENLFEQNRKAYLPTVRVVRGGKTVRIPADDVVVGDVALLSFGDVVPFDARLVATDRFSVRMKLPSGKTEDMKKYAEGAAGNEDVFHAPNLVFASSAVLSGSARCLVLAVGEKTAYGAGQGPIESKADTSPTPTLRNAFHNERQYHIAAGICLVPTVILVLLLSQGDATILTTLSSIAAVAVLGGHTLYRTAAMLFYVLPVLHCRESANASLLPSADAAERLSAIDALVLADHSLTSDGILHFYAVATPEGMIAKPEQIKILTPHLPGVAMLASLPGSVGVSVNGQTEGEKYAVGIRELASLTGVDREAVRIRFSPFSLLPAGAEDGSDIVYYTDAGKEKILYLSTDPSALSRSSYYLKGDDALTLTPELSQNAERHFAKLSRDGYTVLSVSLANKDAPDVRTFLGALCFRERTEEIGRLASICKAYGVRIVPCGSEPVSSVVSRLRSQNLKVAVAGRGTELVGASALADFTVTTTDVTTSRVKDLTDSTQASVVHASQQLSAPQVVREKADMLLSPRKDGHGGLASFCVGLYEVRSIAGRLRAFAGYLCSMTLVRTVLALFPLLSGRVYIDARHLLVSGLFFDLAALVFFARMPMPEKVRSRTSPAKGLTSLLSEHIEQVVPAVFTAVLAVLLPWIIDAAGLLSDSFIYYTEYVDLALVLLTALVMTVTLLRPFDGKEVPRSFVSVICPLGFLLFSLLTAVVPAMRTGWLGMESVIPFGYIAVLLLTVALYPLGVFGMKVLKKKRNM